MVRCKCGVWTDYGLTCTKCRADTPASSDPPPSETDPREIDFEDLDIVDPPDEEEEED